MGFGEPGDVVDDLCGAGLDAAVVAVGGGGDVVRRRVRIVEQEAHVVEERGLIGLERQHVITAALENGRGGLVLAVHGIGGDDAALQRQQGEQLGQRRDLVGPVVDPQLTEHQARLAGPGADQMQRRPTLLAVKGAARGLAGDRDHALDRAASAAT